MEPGNEASLSKSPEKEIYNVSTSSTKLETNGHESNSDATVTKDTLRVVNLDHPYARSFRNPWKAESQEQRIMEETTRKFRAATGKLREDVMGGNWNKVKEEMLEVEPYLGRPELYWEMKLLILEQQYMELLEEGKPDDALTAIQEEPGLIKRIASRLETVRWETPQEIWERAGLAGKSGRAQLVEHLDKILAPLGPYTETYLASRGSLPFWPKDCPGVAPAAAPFVASEHDPFALSLAVELQGLGPERAAADA